VESGTCSRKDIILPLVIVGFVRREELDFGDLFVELLDGREFDNVLEYIEWIGKEERVLGRRGTNAFKVYERIIRTRF
jgi:hypothetical protein